MYYHFSLINNLTFSSLKIFNEVLIINVHKLNKYFFWSIQKLTFVNYQQLTK